MPKIIINLPESFNDYNRISRLIDQVKENFPILDESNFFLPKDGITYPEDTPPQELTLTEQYLAQEARVNQLQTAKFKAEKDYSDAKDKLHTMWKEYTLFEGRYKFTYNPSFDWFNLNAVDSPGIGDYVVCSLRKITNTNNPALLNTWEASTAKNYKSQLSAEEIHAIHLALEILNKETACLRGKT